MVRQRRSHVVRAIKHQAEEGQYRMTYHVLVEMDADNLVESDVINVIVKGKLEKNLSGDPRGPRYVFRGKTDDGREAEVVCRPLGSKISIITAYVVD